MPGPNSAPNGDRSLTSRERNWCKFHGDDDWKKRFKIKCSDNCDKFVTKREFLAARNRLWTGKTSA